MAVLSLYHLQAYYWNEWERGLAGTLIHIHLLNVDLLSIGMGEFALVDDCNTLTITEDEMYLIQTSSLDELIVNLKQCAQNKPAHTSPKESQIQIEEATEERHKNHMRYYAL